MPLAIGSRLGPYEIVAPLGAGGMGEVYRARDTRLGRDVAIKVLPEAVADDPDRLARFEREARAVAALSHPNILGLHDFDRADRVVYAVMELLEGETLRSRLQSGPLSVRKSVEAGVQIARGLAAAHDKGLVHRDLKPENVFLLADGQVKVLDFGLARAAPAQSAVTETAGTDPGVVMGTVGYMAPEQVRGQVADARTDLFALGVVLYEMLSGQRAFRRDTPAETMTAVLKDDPPELTGTRPELSPALDRIVRHSLEKNPAERFQTARDVAFALDALSGSSTSGTRALPAESAGRRRHSLMATGAVVAAILVAAAWRWQLATPPAGSVVRLATHIGADAFLVSMLPSWNRSPAVIVAPDGGMLAFVAATETGRTDLYLRRLDQLRATVVPGTEGAINPFFSPHGDWIGFFATNELKKVSVQGGVPISICRLPMNLTGVRGAWWSEDGTIVFQPSGTSARLERVPATGGTPEPVGTGDPDSVTIRWPQVLPGGRSILYTSHKSLTNFESADLVVRSAPVAPPRVVMSNAYHGRYVASGHLLFMRESRLMAAPFDVNRLTVVGPVVPVLDGIETSTGNAGAQFSVSDAGTLVYVEGTSALDLEGPMTWLDDSGRVTPLRSSVLAWGNPKFSPDGRTVAFMVSDGKQFHVWTYEWAREAADRLAFDVENDTLPVWSPTGGAVVFAGGRGVDSNLYWRRADRTGNSQRLTTGQQAQRPWSWHPSGKYLAITEEDPERNNQLSIKILTMEGDDTSGWKIAGEALFTKTTSASPAPEFSPDGRWIAYSNADDSGRFQVFVRPFQGDGGPWQISTAGGTFPTWSKSRPELFFATPGSQIMRAGYAAEGNAFRIVRQPTLWTTTGFRGVGVGRPFDLHPDGRRFVIKPAQQAQASPKVTQVVLVFNFFEELRRLAKPE